MRSSPVTITPRKSRETMSTALVGGVLSAPVDPAAFQGRGQRRSFHSGDEPLGVVIETVDTVQQAVGDGRRVDIEVFGNAAG